MSDSLYIGDNSPEEVAHKLMTQIAAVEGRALIRSSDILQTGPIFSRPTMPASLWFAARSPPKAQKEPPR
jgi:hypothetical protein